MHPVQVSVALVLPLVRARYIRRPNFEIDILHTCMLEYICLCMYGEVLLPLNNLHVNIIFSHSYMI